MIGWNLPNSHSFFKIQSLAAVLVAIAIPVFTTQLERSREATDVANIRSAYADVVVTYLDSASATTITVPVQQRVAGVQTSPVPVLVYQANGSQGSYSLETALTGKSAATDSYTVGISVNTTTGAVEPSVG